MPAKTETLAVMKRLPNHTLQKQRGIELSSNPQPSVKETKENTLWKLNIKSSSHT
jgi:hypothetical protein